MNEAVMLVNDFRGLYDGFLCHNSLHFCSYSDFGAIGFHHLIFVDFVDYDNSVVRKKTPPSSGGRWICGTFCQYYSLDVFHYQSLYAA